MRSSLQACHSYYAQSCKVEVLSDLANLFLLSSIFLVSEIPTSVRHLDARPRIEGGQHRTEGVLHACMRDVLMTLCAIVALIMPISASAVFLASLANVWWGGANRPSAGCGLLYCQ
jgi:hypothetical protein